MEGEILARPCRRWGFRAAWSVKLSVPGDIPDNLKKHVQMKRYQIHGQLTPGTSKKEMLLDLAAVEALGRHGRCVRLAAAAPNQPDLSGSAFGLEAEPRVFRSPDIQKEMQSGLHWYWNSRHYPTDNEWIRSSHILGIAGLNRSWVSMPWVSNWISDPGILRFP